MRHLRSDRFTAYDLDLDADIAILGLSYNSSFRIRFCQYENNPAPMDGIFIRRITLTAELRAPILHLTIGDNADSPIVLDASAGAHHQSFTDPGGAIQTPALTRLPAWSAPP